MKYTEVKFFNVPYSENDRYVPLYQALPESWTPIPATRTINDSVYPDTPKDIFTRIKVPINYNDIINCNYMSAIYHPSNNKNTYIIYAWIDNITPENDENDPKPVEYNYNSSTIIEFHIDYWRTYIEKITIKEGLILNRKPSNELAYKKDPPQNIPHIYEYSLIYEHKIPGQIPGIMWVILLYLQNPINNDDIKHVKRLALPVSVDDPTKHIQFNDSHKITFKAPSLNDVINGILITKLNLASEKVQGCFISPISPIPIIKYENDLLTLDWKQTSETLEFTYTDFLESFEGDSSNIKIYADHGNQYIVNDPDAKKLHICYTVGDEFSIDWFKSAGYEEVEEAKEAINRFLNKNLFVGKYDDFEIFTGAVGRIYKVRCHEVAIEYIPFIEWVKRNFVNFYDYTQFTFKEGDEVYLKDPNKDLWTRHDEHPATTIYERQNFFKENNRVKAILVTGYNTEAILADNTTQVVSDYDVWIKNIPTTIIASPKSALKLDLEEIKYDDKTNYYGINASASFWPSIGEDFKQSLISTDTTDLVLLDMSGQPIKRFNKKVKINTITTELITSSNTAAILLRFNKYHSALNQLETIIPCTPLEIGNSYYNEYIISGQRQSDLEHMSLSINQSLISAGINTALSALPLNPVAMGQAFVTGVNLWKESFFMGQNQEQHEKDIKHKGNFLTRQSGDFSWIKNGTPICIAMLKIDDYSSQNYGTTIKEFGIAVNEFVKNIELTEGPIRIQGAIIIGNVPFQARDFIKNKLANGIYLNPELSKPHNN